MYKTCRNIMIAAPGPKSYNKDVFRKLPEHITYFMEERL